MSTRCKAFAIATLGATQLMLGCAPSVEEETDPFLVKLPASMETPEKFVGNWAEAKGSQRLVLSKDGKSVLKNKVKISAQGANQEMDTETECKWGTAGEKFYFHGFPNNGPSLEYDFKFEGEKLLLTQKGVKAILTYSKETAK